MAAATIAASAAISIAKGHLEADLRKLTEGYQQQLDVKKGKLIKLSQIALDTETANFLMERLSKVSQGNFKI